jgi:hypothetical protein
MQGSSTTGAREKRQATLRFQPQTFAERLSNSAQMQMQAPNAGFRVPYMNQFCGHTQMQAPNAGLGAPLMHPFCGCTQKLNWFVTEQQRMFKDVCTRLFGNTSCLQMPKEWRQWTREYPFNQGEQHAKNLRGWPLPAAQVHGMACFYDLLCGIFGDNKTWRINAEMHKFCTEQHNIQQASLQPPQAAYLNFDGNTKLHLGVQIFHFQSETGILQVSETFEHLLQTFLQRMQEFDLLPPSPNLSPDANQASSALHKPTFAPECCPLRTPHVQQSMKPHFCGVMRLGYLALDEPCTEENRNRYLHQWTRDCTQDSKPLAFDADHKPLANPDDARGCIPVFDVARVCGEAKDTAKGRATLQHLLAIGIAKRDVFWVKIDGDRVVIAIGWKGKDGSEPMKILLTSIRQSKNITSVVANSANRTTAPRSPSAVEAPSGPPDNQQTSSAMQEAGFPPELEASSAPATLTKPHSEVEYTQTEETIEDEGGATSVRKTQQTHVRTDEGASVTLHRGVEEGTRPDGTPFVRLGQDMRVEDKEGASMQAAQRIEMNGEFVSLVLEMRNGNLAICNMVAQMQAQNQQMQVQNQQAMQQSQQAMQQSQQTMELVVQQNQKLEQQQKDVANDLANIQQQLHSQQQQHKDDLANIQQELRSQQEQSAGAPSNAQGGPAPPADQALNKRARPSKKRGRPTKSTAGAASNAEGGPAPGPAPPADQAPRKRGRPRKRSRAGSAGAASEQAAVANQDKRAPLCVGDRNQDGLASQNRSGYSYDTGIVASQNVQSYPEEEKTKDKAMGLLFEKWKTDIKYLPKFDAWFVHYHDVNTSCYKIRSPLVSFEEACYLRRQLCLSSKDREQGAINLWPRMKYCSIPKTLHNDAVRRFRLANRGSL